MITVANPGDQDAVQTLEKEVFVDDLLGGEETRDGVGKQVQGTKIILGKGGFSLKFVVYRGAKPCDKASSDRETVKMLGYK